ncbi:hypothetical protein N657DRAFT_302121 [Parathielavia appendiculata]|uniref:Secreted protein n=1 Tax=Parathielavia appendiculata TaxID=2587402 RepID=A0AAN6Z5D6_9PEZI|nr:hypothetical protein N657DRAFT_302121 [Parathielavia appendiculata]
MTLSFRLWVSSLWVFLCLGMNRRRNGRRLEKQVNMIPPIRSHFHFPTTQPRHTAPSISRTHFSTDSKSEHNNHIPSVANYN